MLRVHLDKHHRDEYLKLAAERGWYVQLVSQRKIPRIAIVETDENVNSIVTNDQVRVKQLSFDHSSLPCTSS